MEMGPRRPSVRENPGGIRGFLLMEAVKLHIPDGFLDTRTWVSLALVSGGSIACAARKVRVGLDERRVPLMGVASAFIFAAQMLNFPIVAGTSGHLLGGTLAAVLLGPWAGAVALTTVLVVQALVFQDGGLSALGANVFNMAVLGTMVIYYVYTGLARVMRGKVILAAGVTAWFSTVLAATAAAIELAFSGTSPLSMVLPAMAGIHALIGIGEAAITSVVLGMVYKVRPDLIYMPGYTSGEGGAHLEQP